MRYVNWVLGTVLAIWGVFAICLVTLWSFGLLDAKPETYVIDAKEVVRIFVAEEGKNLSEADMVTAIRLIDGIVLAQAEQIYRESGSVIINKNHMLAGGTDVSVAFALRVIAAWKASQ